MPTQVPGDLFIARDVHAGAGQFQPITTDGSPAGNSSVIVAFVLVPRGQQQDVEVTNCEQDDTPIMAERNDQFPKLAVCFRSAAGVWRKGQQSDPAIHRIAEPQETRFVGCMARQFTLHDRFLEARDVLLKRSGRNNSEPVAHSSDRLVLAATIPRIRCCAA